ncbi:MAG: hypothetical protein ACJATA_001095 [Sphingobacteriales bacterium]|jgi:hypothetical protein
MKTILIKERKFDFSFSQCMLQLKLVSNGPIEASIDYSDKTNSQKPTRMVVNEGKLFAPPYFNIFESGNSHSLLSKEFTVLITSPQSIERLNLIIKPIQFDGGAVIAKNLNLMVTLKTTENEEIAIPFNFELNDFETPVFSFRKRGEEIELIPQNSITLTQ